MPWLAFGVDDGPEKNQRLKSFFLVGWSQLQCFCQVPRGKNFSACEKFLFAHISSATAFGGGLGSKHCTSVPWLCECWCGKIWECFKSPDAPFGTILDEYALRDGWHPSCYREHPQCSTGNIPKGGIRRLKSTPKCDCTSTRKAMAR